MRWPFSRCWGDVRRTSRNGSRCLRTLLRTEAEITAEHPGFWTDGLASIGVRQMTNRVMIEVMPTEQGERLWEELSRKYDCLERREYAAAAPFAGN